MEKQLVANERCRQGKQKAFPVASDERRKADEQHCQSPHDANEHPVGGKVNRRPTPPVLRKGHLARRVRAMSTLLPPRIILRTPRTASSHSSYLLPIRTSNPPSSLHPMTHYVVLKALAVSRNQANANKLSGAHNLERIATLAKFGPTLKISNVAVRADDALDLLSRAN